MAVIRAAILALTILGFLALGVPLHWLARRWNRRLAERLPLLFHRAMCRILRLRVHYYGVPSPEWPQLIVPNHVSWLDILAIGAHQPVCFLTKQEVAGWPIFGWLARLQGAVFVDRSRRMAIPAVNRCIANRLAVAENVVLFAEATTGDGNRILKFHSPHFEAARLALPNQPHSNPKTMLQPVAINYVRRDGLPLGRIERAGVAWYGDTGFVPHLWAILRSGSLECEVTYGTATPFLPESDRKTAALALQVAVRRLSERARSGRKLGAAARSDRDQAVLLGTEKTQRRSR